MCDQSSTNTELKKELIEETRKIKIAIADIFEDVKAELEEGKQFQRNIEDWKSMESELSSGKYAIVLKTDIERLITEAMQIKEFLPKVLKKEFFTAYTNLEKAEQELSELKKEKKNLKTEIERMKNKHQNVLSELEGERKELTALRKSLNELNEINSQQSEYCSRMGAASCSLLWRTSQKDACVETLVAGTQIDEFLQLVCHTLESYALTISHDDGEGQLYDESSAELQFVLALCGVATNIAAASYGREFLTTNSNGVMLIGSLVSTLFRLAPKAKQALKIRNLCLKFLYNISINKKGVENLSKQRQQHEILPALIGIIEDDISLENRLLAVRLLQSLMLETDNIKMIHQIDQMLSVEKLRNIAVNVHGELQEALLELIRDMKFFQRES
eukprot:gene14016-15475_t